MEFEKQEEPSHNLSSFRPEDETNRTAVCALSLLETEVSLSIVKSPVCLVWMSRKESLGLKEPKKLDNVLKPLNTQKQNAKKKERKDDLEDEEFGSLRTSIDLHRIQKLRHFDLSSLSSFSFRDTNVRQDTVAVSLIQEENLRICEKSTMISEILQRDKIIKELRARVKQQEALERELGLLNHARSDLELADRQVDQRVRLQVRGLQCEMLFSETSQVKAEKKHWLKEQDTKRQVLRYLRSLLECKQKLKLTRKEMDARRRKVDDDHGCQSFSHRSSISVLHLYLTARRNDHCDRVNTLSFARI